MPFSMKACDYQVTDISAYQLSNLLKKRFGDNRILHRPMEALASKLKYKAFGALDISEHSYGSDVEIRVPAMGDRYYLQVILSGSCTWSGNGQQAHLQHGDSIVLTPFDEYTMFYSHDCSKLIVKIPGDFLKATAREFGYLSSDLPIRFQPQGLAHDKSGAIHNLMSDILSQDASTLSDRASLYYSKLLGNAILNTYSNDASTGLYMGCTGNRQIEQIRNHVLDNITTNLPSDDLANLCRISRKSLYNLFKREVGMTPSTYIRQLKLAAVYSELNDNPSIRNITEVALKYGFTNLGRFSAQYRAYIGELPSETLRRPHRL